MSIQSQTWRSGALVLDIVLGKRKKKKQEDFNLINKINFSMRISNLKVILQAIVFNKISSQQS